MRAISFLLALVAFLLVSLAPPTSACGDKYLVQGKAQRFARVYAPSKPASILIYEDPDSKGIASVTLDQTLNTLRQVGHTVFVCRNRAECETAVGTGHYDVILADVADVPELEKLVAGRSPRPAVLPVAYRATRSELMSMRGERGVVFNAPARPKLLLTTLDRVLVGR